MVSWFAHYKLIPLLLKYGAKVNLQEFNGAAPLHFGCWNGSVEVCTALLDAGADINLKDQYGRTPLYYSVQHKHPEIVKLLLSRHADPSIQTCNGITPETQANQDGNIELIEIFQKYSKEQEKLERERRAQEAEIAIKKKFGKNAILKGMNFLEGATQKERNAQIGGHKA